MFVGGGGGGDGDEEAPVLPLSDSISVLKTRIKAGLGADIACPRNLKKGCYFSLKFAKS